MAFFKQVMRSVWSNNIHLTEMMTFHFPLLDTQHHTRNVTQWGAKTKSLTNIGDTQILCKMWFVPHLWSLDFLYHLWLFKFSGMYCGAGRLRLEPFCLQIGACCPQTVPPTGTAIFLLMHFCPRLMLSWGSCSFESCWGPPCGSPEPAIEHEWGCLWLSGVFPRMESCPLI
jgi:hypothetical protein